MISETIRITFDEADPAGFLFFGQFAHLSHRLFEKFVISQGITWDEWYNSPHWGSPVRHFEAEYWRPVLAGKSYTLELQLTHLGQSSLKYKTVFKDNEAVCAQLTTTHAFVDRKTLQKMEIPKSLRKKLEGAEVLPS